MSAREFKLGDRVRTKDVGLGVVLKIAKYNGDVIVWTESDGRAMTYDPNELEHEPPAQPHVAAGRGEGAPTIVANDAWKRRFATAIETHLEAVRAFVKDVSEENAELAIGTYEAIDTMIAEVVELPEPDGIELRPYTSLQGDPGWYEVFKNGSSCGVVDPEYTLSLAAALIRAATGPGAISQGSCSDPQPRAPSEHS